MANMDIGIQSNLWGTDQHGGNLPQILADIAGAGYAGIEIGAHRFEDLDHPDVFLSMLKNVGLQVSGIHTIGRFYFDGDLAYAERAADFTKAVGSGYMIVSGDSRDGKTLEDLKDIANVLNRVGEICRDREIIYCYHNHAYEFTNEGSEFEALCELTDPDNVSLCLDIGWVERAGVSPVEITQKYLARIQYLHIKDTLNDTFVNLGEGTVDIPNVVNSFKDQKHIYFTVELDEVVPDSLDRARKCREYLMGLGL
jgi:sugar phosphate isomerase/epimerase